MTQKALHAQCRKEVAQKLCFQSFISAPAVCGPAPGGCESQLLFARDSRRSLLPLAGDEALQSRGGFCDNHGTATLSARSPRLVVRRQPDVSAAERPVRRAAGHEERLCARCVVERAPLSATELAR